MFWLGKGYIKPLFLLTNLELGFEACQYYKRRFKIETLFKHLESVGFHLHKTRLKCPVKVANLIILVAFIFIFSFCTGAFIKNNVLVKTLVIMVRKDRLKKIYPIAAAQLSIKQNATCVLIFFSELSSNFYQKMCTLSKNNIQCCKYSESGLSEAENTVGRNRLATNVGPLPRPNVYSQMHPHQPWPRRGQTFVAKASKS